MDFELSDDQVALRAVAHDLLAGRATSTHVRRVVDEGSGWDRSLWSEMVTQGWPGIAVGEDAGGVGLGWVEAAVLCEAVGARVAPAPIISQIIALEALAGSGAEVDGNESAGLIDGSRIAAVSADLSRPVPFAPSADVIVAIVDGAVVAFAGSHPRSEPAMDRTRELGWVNVPEKFRRLTIPVERFLDCGAVGYAAELLGGCQAMLDTSVAYAKDRVQFDRPIGSFQAVKHRLADMLVDVEAMRSIVYWAAWCLSANDDESNIAASSAKAWCVDASKRVMSSALQIHGGIGFTWESDVHLYLKRAQLSQIEFGDAVFHRSRVAGELRSRMESGVSVI